jgi:hypothetical protein
VTNASRIVDAYTKGGNIGLYAASFGLVPDYEIGFSTLSTGDHPGGQESPVRATMIDIYVSNMNCHKYELVLTISPQYNAIEVAMKDQAKATFTGTYRGSSGLNSSVTLGVDEGPGVRVTSWISNGTDMINNVFWAANIKEYRLFPTDLSYEENGVRYHKYVLEFLFNEYGEEFRDTDFWSVCEYLSQSIGSG